MSCIAGPNARGGTSPLPACGGTDRRRVCPQPGDVSYHADGTVAAIGGQRRRSAGDLPSGLCRIWTKLISGQNDCAFHGGHQRPCNTGAVPRLHPAAVSARRDTFTVRYATASKVCCCNMGRSPEDSGYQEMTLSSLSTSDYKPLNDLCDGLMEYCEANKGASFSAIAAGGQFFPWVAAAPVQGRKAGLTFRPGGWQAAPARCDQ